MRIETVLLSAKAGAAGAAAVDDLQGMAAAAREIEGLGFDAAATPESGHDPFLPLVVAAEHTARIGLGTNVAIAFPRSPMAVAQMAWDLQRLSKGRFLLGLGTQVKGHNERRYSTPWRAAPGPRVREYVRCLRAIFQTFQHPASPTFFEGEHYTFTLMSPFFNPGPIEHPHVPIYISALNPYMARLAGELCDGLRLHPLLTADYTRAVIGPAIAEGARRAGRPASVVDVVATPFLVTGKTDAEIATAKNAVRQHIAFYASTRTYHTVLEYHGWGAAGRNLHELSVAGRWSEMGALITDEMLEAFATIATYDELGPRLRERWRDVCSSLFLTLPPALRADGGLVTRTLDSLRAS